MNKELVEHWDEMRLLFQGGLLTKKDGWRNVVEHQTTQLFGAIALGELLNLSADDRKNIQTVALVHDWEKRWDKLHENPSFVETEKITEYLCRVNPDPQLMKATGPEFLVRVLAGESSYLELLQFYLDDITKGNQIVKFDERIDEVEKRRQDLNQDKELTARLGGRKYWEVEREIGHEVERLIDERLRARGIILNSPDEIPGLIRIKMQEKLNE